MKKLLITSLIAVATIAGINNASTNINNQSQQQKLVKFTNILALQTDFGLKDTAVASMKGIAYQVSPNLIVADATHEIPAYSIWDASYRLKQTINYWPKGTVFVSVVDPGVGTNRKSVVALLKTGHYIVTPDNGTLTLLDDEFGISQVRVIDEKTNRLEGSAKSYTFHGRDVYVYTGARLASGKISFEQVGAISSTSIVKLPYTKPSLDSNGVLTGTIDSLDPQYGNVWTNITDDLLIQSGIKLGDKVNVVIKNNGKQVYNQDLPYVLTFGDVAEGYPLVYLNSSLELAVALNMDNFAAKNNISYGNDWTIIITKKK